MPGLRPRHDPPTEHARSAVDELLGLAGRLPASFAGDGEVLQRGRNDVAPPTRHLLLDGDRGCRRRPAREQRPAGYRSDVAFRGNEQRL
jgi:hypothetical protein